MVHYMSYLLSIWKEELKRGPLQPIMTLGPFEKWGLDFMGPLPRSHHHGKYYTLVATNYVTRCAEAKAVVRCDAKSVVNFLRGKYLYSLWMATGNCHRSWTNF